MEPVSLALATLVLIKPMCDTIQSTLTSYSQYAKDAESLRLQFQDARVRLDAFEQILCTHDRFAPKIRGRLVDSLDAEQTAVIEGLVQELHFGLQQYIALQLHREELNVNSTVPDTSGDEVRVDTCPPSGTLVLSGTSSPKGVNSMAIAKLRLLSTGRRIRWSISRRSTTQSVVQNFEFWTMRMRNNIETIIWSMFLDSTADQLQTFSKDEDVSNVGLLKGIRIRELLATPPTQLEAQVEGLYSRAFQKSGSVGTFDIGTIHQKEGFYLIEYKTGDNGSTEQSSSRTREQIIKLAALLRDAPSSDEELGVLPCTNYMEDSPHELIGLVYALPSTYSADSVRPKSLSDLLLNPSTPKLGLDSRIRIACSIFYTVHRLHVYGWVHKSLRADNILFLPNDPNNSSLGYNLAEPKLLGFDWARKDDEISPQEAGLNIRRNLYRHPRRWGQPTSRFDKVHDIYALGVILLELGLGHSVFAIEGGALFRDPKYHDCDTLSKRLLYHIRQRLGFYCGARLQGIIVGCLTGTWRGNPVADQLVDIVAALAETVEAIEGEA